LLGNLLACVLSSWLAGWLDGWMDGWMDGILADLAFVPHLYKHTDTAEACPVACCRHESPPCAYLGGGPVRL
jgi:hypothetical protein